MISKIDIKNIACYDATGISFEPTKINFIYGSNGSGKTTLSKIIDTNSLSLDSKIHWKDSNELNTLVYNKDFIDKNITANKEIKGVFTLGEDADNAQKEIESRKISLDLNEKGIVANKNSLDTTNQRLVELENDFTNKCWEYKSKYDDDFKVAFTGVRGNKDSFKGKVILEVANVSDIKTLIYLKERASIIFDETATKLTAFTNIEFEEFLTTEKSTILDTKILGKDDVDISAMIKKLNNSDWVKQGKVLLDANENICPFCQRETEEDFRKQLEEYFDETYIKQLSDLTQFRDDYKRLGDLIIVAIDNIHTANHKYIDSESLALLIETLKANYSKNLLVIGKKIAEPSVSLAILSLEDSLNKISALIKAAIDKTAEHNNSIDNIATEKPILIGQVWKFIINELSADFSTYNLKKINLNKAVVGITKGLGIKQTKERELKTEIADFEKKITSIIPTIDTINKTLTSFGFTNFKLIPADLKGYYKIIRENGEEAKETLSEGEKTFITFLYFHSLIKGSIDESAITANKIVVFDDPISSLDSSVLFIVSNLIRQTIRETKADTGIIKQVFILTHNVYFQKEVTFKKDRNKDEADSYWIIRKINKLSKIFRYDENPIKTSYELLWQEIRTEENRKSITIQNTLRRILENYFKILGDYNDDKILSKFEGEEITICRSLMSWINDGSHFTNDDLFVDIDEEMIEKYFIVFKKIFIVTEHAGHYNMMMRISDNNVNLDSSNIAALEFHKN